MKGYPKHLNTKQDVENLIKDHPEFSERIKQDLQRIIDEPDTVTKATTLIDEYDESKGYKTEIIPNPNPRWKKMGFVNKKEVQNINTVYADKIAGVSGEDI